ncbi:MAG: CHRD domain-containing protein [Verrucomicrobia bacterium]|nr:CHRD domain-containing protein [Verrucomicrobiota bacterium]
MLNQTSRLTSLVIALGLWVAVPDAAARSFRVNQLPNGNVFGCANCHVSAGGGGARNPFGQAVGAITGSSSAAFWSASLAALDSDGDGFSNGFELGDPEGDGTVIPGWRVTNPGSAASRPQNAAPTVAITAPANNATLTAPAVVTITADAADSDGTVASVEFLNNGLPLGSDSTSPYSWLADLPVGSHVLTARATDNLGASATSAPINVTVVAPPPISLNPPTLAAGNLVVTWTGGGGPFLVETKSDLAQAWPGQVQGVTERSAQVPAGGAAGFVRVADTAVIGPLALTSTLSGANERPTPVVSPGTGSGTFSLDGSTLTLTITYSGLSGPATAAHIHGPAGPEENAPMMINLAPFHSGAFGTSGTMAGSVILTPEQKAALLTGRTYVNIHTANFPAGEIRGQILR